MTKFSKVEIDWAWEDWALGQIKANVCMETSVKYLNDRFPNYGRNRYDALDIVQWAGRARLRQSFYPMSKPADILEFRKKS